MALNRKIAYIDLSTGKIEIKPIPLDVRKKFLGGRGLDAYLLYNHTKKGCDPLGPDNTLMVSGGVLTATLASATCQNPCRWPNPRSEGCWGAVTWGVSLLLSWPGQAFIISSSRERRTSPSTCGSTMARSRSAMPRTSGVKRPRKPSGPSGKSWGMRILRAWSSVRRVKIS